jgi:hypothetical protein
MLEADQGEGRDPPGPGGGRGGQTAGGRQVVPEANLGGPTLGRTAVPHFMFDLQVPEAADRGRSTQARTGSDDLSQGTNSD